MSDLDRVSYLSVADFRSIAGSLLVPLNAPVVIIHGSNGTGKTSVLSALELALTGEIRAMSGDDPTYARHLVHEGTTQSSIFVLDEQKRPFARGSFVVTEGAIKGTALLAQADKKFFAERCYLAQSMLGKLLDIYQKSKVKDGESALTEFVKDLLGLNQLDSLITGLHDAGHKRRTQNLVPEYRAFESRLDRTAKEIEDLEQELQKLDESREGYLSELKRALGMVLPDVSLEENDLVDLVPKVRWERGGRDLIEVRRKLSELESVSRAWDG